MQLSAPASFSETLIPAVPGEISADASSEGAVPGDFAALFSDFARQQPSPRSVAGGPPAASVSSRDVAPGLRGQSEGGGWAVMPNAAPVIIETEATAEPLLAETPVDAPVDETTDDETDAVESPETMAFLPFSEPASRQAAPFLAKDPVRWNHRTGEPSVTQGEGRAAGQAVRASLHSPSASATQAGHPVPTASLDAGAPAAAGVDPRAGSPTSKPADSPSADSPVPPAGDRSAAAVLARPVDLAPRGPKLRRELSAEDSALGSNRTPAKIAAMEPRITELSQVGKTAAEKNFLNIDGEVVTKPDMPIGTGVALKEPIMTNSAPATASPAVVSVSVAPREVSFDLGAPPALTPEAKAGAPESIERMAHRAVEAVAATIERGAAQSAQSVSLKFSMHGAELVVRVALRAEELQVTFRTDSEDLRTALAHEWQAVRGRDPEGALQSVTPVFTSGDTGHSASQHQTGGRDQAATFANLQAQADAQSQRQFGRHAAPTQIVTAGAESGSNASPRTLPAETTGAARLLHTFA